MSKSLPLWMLCWTTLLSLGCGQGVVPPESAGPVASPEAPRSPKADDPWAWLCEDAAAGSDGVCTDMCVDFDPDCGAKTDSDAGQGPHGDGGCEGPCPGVEPQGEEPVDACFKGYRYADGQCDEDCPHPDPDCAHTPGPDALAHWEVEVCGFLYARKKEASDCSEPEPKYCVDEEPCFCVSS